MRKQEGRSKKEELGIESAGEDDGSAQPEMWEQIGVEESVVGCCRIDRMELGRREDGLMS